MFLLEILQNRVVIKAMGLFQIDLTIVPKVFYCRLQVTFRYVFRPLLILICFSFDVPIKLIGTTLTYLIILIQFQTPDE